MPDDEQKEKVGETEELEKVKADWDKDKQAASQEHANFVKVTEEKTAIAEELQSRLLEVDELKQQLSDKDKVYPDLDPDLVDKNVIKSLTQMKTDLKTATEELTTLRAKAEKYEQKEQQKEAKDETDRLTEKLLTPLDDEFGAKYRNDARKLADTLIDTGKAERPSDAIDIMVLMRKCYIQVSEKKKETVRTDTGIGGIPPPAADRKAGTMQEVVTDMKKDKSWL